MKRNRQISFFVFAFLILFNGLTSQAQEKLSAMYATESYIAYTKGNDLFKIADQSTATEIVLDPHEWKGVMRAAEDLSSDIEKVVHNKAGIRYSGEVSEKKIVVGTLGKSALIERAVQHYGIDVSEIKGQWESFMIVVREEAILVIGSDKRATIFGLYDISEKIGVSPWYWWADVPIQERSELYAKAGIYLQESPKVQYRGIFINDEEPSFGQWARNKFGGMNSKMYCHIFELLLRLKANYFWPAMWGKAFSEDDPENPRLADEYGIVMGTSHHEPMMRAHKEYTVRRDEVGPWDYSSNKDRLDQFFLDGLKRNKDFENIVTIGMRGDGDVAMSEGGDRENMRVLKDVISGQRGIIKEVYGERAGNVPQLWAIFTEVQRYYDAGFTVPDDVTLLFCDNNWGYIRRTGPKGERKRKGGMGLYYHIDMNGGPWNDRWINTTTIPKLREQFNLAYQTGLDKIWIVNVGDLKPKELPIDFIMRYAWDPEALPPDGTMDYTTGWASNIFGPALASEIADIVSRYSKYNLLRKPEVQSPDIFSLVNYREAHRMLAKWSLLVKDAERIAEEIPAGAKDAYYQLVLYPVKASAGVAEIYLASGWNKLLAKQGRPAANAHALRAKELFSKDQELSDYYNDTLSAGKWKYMMSDKHIGYKIWSMPEKNQLPALTSPERAGRPEMGISLEGSRSAWPNDSLAARLPAFDALFRQAYYIDVFNRGSGSFDFGVIDKPDWLKLSVSEGRVETEKSILLEVDWNVAPKGHLNTKIGLQGGGESIPVEIELFNETPASEKAFFGTLSNTEFSIPADQFSSRKASDQAEWIRLADLGRGDAAMGITPVTAEACTDPDKSASLDYRIYLPQKGKVRICLGILPTQDVEPRRGLRIGLRIDQQKMEVLDARQGYVDTFDEYTSDNLSRSPVLKALPAPVRDLKLVSGESTLMRNEIFDNLRWIDAEFEVEEAGFHELSVVMIDPEIVLESIVVNPDNNRPSYFGPPPKLHTPSGMKF